MKKQENANGARWQQDPAQRIADPQVLAIVNQLPSNTDPNGSYTGRPLDRSEQPQQDADDL